MKHLQSHGFFSINSGHYPLPTLASFLNESGVSYEKADYLEKRGVFGEELVNVSTDGETDLGSCVTQFLEQQGVTSVTNKDNTFFYAKSTKWSYIVKVASEKNHTNVYLTAAPEETSVAPPDSPSVMGMSYSGVGNSGARGVRVQIKSDF